MRDPRSAPRAPPPPPYGLVLPRLLTQSLPPLLGLHPDLLALQLLHGGLVLLRDTPAALSPGPGQASRPDTPPLRGLQRSRTACAAPGQGCSLVCTPQACGCSAVASPRPGRTQTHRQREARKTDRARPQSSQTVSWGACHSPSPPHRFRCAYATCLLSDSLYNSLWWRVEPVLFLRSLTTCSE